MSWGDVWKVILAALASVGGIGGLIVLVIRFSANTLADRLSKKYELKLQKDLEGFKSDLNKKEYVSKTKFDTEFTLYRELSSAFAEMVKAIWILIPAGLTNVPADDEDRKEFDRMHYEAALPAVVNAQDTLNANIPFISEDIYDGYSELLSLARVQLSEYEDRFNIYDLRPKEEKERFSIEAYQRTYELNEKWKALNNTIRDYISKLDVVEDK